MGNIIAIVGRPNVGKSTFFNRLTGSREAIVDAESGVTRDRHYGRSDWNGKEFSVIDTGGIVVGSDDVFESEIIRQADLAIDEADIILLLVDAREGLTPLDQDVAVLLRRSKKKIFLVANKVDNPALVNSSSEFYSLGLGEVYPISAISGSGTGELLDALVNELTESEEENLEGLPKISVVGRPNVGKSSLINALLGTERHIVTPVAGTTRDSLFTRYSSFGFDFLLVDTAGIRRRTKVKEDLEFYSVLRSIRSIESSDVCILMLDAQNGIEAQDLNIFQIIRKNRKGVVIVVNKWDLLEKQTNTMRDYEKTVRERLAPFDDIPIIFTSVKTKQRIFKTLETVRKVYECRNARISTSELNETFLPVIEKTPPPSYKGKYVKIKYITQLPTPFPAFAFFCNLPQYIREPYKRFIENRFREIYNFHGVPIEIYFRQK
jgi:GTP-binding protein